MMRRSGKSDETPNESSSRHISIEDYVATRDSVSSDNSFHLFDLRMIHINVEPSRYDGAKWLWEAWKLQ